MDNRRHLWLVCLGLGMAVLAAYSPLWHCGFTGYDDPDYVTANEMVKKGITWPGVVWAFSTLHAGNWHPLTWLSHMLDCELYGMNPVGHHLTSLLLHLANSILLFLLFLRLTGAQGPSALVAALFALHPIHVESVAWISERKDVLSAFFGILSIWAYVRHVECLKAGIPGGTRFLALSLLLFAFGLMAKPMLVTLPFVLLLLDYWPLQRFDTAFIRLLAGKVPFLVLSAASCCVTLLAQQRGGAVMSLRAVPLAARLDNAPVACVRYLGKLVWPADLAVLYPFPFHIPLWQTVGATASLAAVTGWVVWRARARTYMAVGWFWFLGMLVPVIGLVQIGPQAMADRYTYLSSVGVFIMVVWAAREWLPRLNSIARAVPAAAAVAACLAATPFQVNYWKDSETLFLHALNSTTDNGNMESNLGAVLLQQDRVDEALPHLLRAVQLTPELPKAHYNLGKAALAKGRVAEALGQFETQVNLQPDDPVAQYNFGDVLLDHGLLEDAIPHLRKAVELSPDNAEFHYKLGNAFFQNGSAAQAAREYEASLRIEPDSVPACNNLAWILATNPDAALRDGAKAVSLASRASQLSGGQNPVILGTLGAACAEAGKFSDAIAATRRALQLAGGGSLSPAVAALRARLALFEAGSPFRDADPVRQPRPPNSQH